MKKPGSPALSTQLLRWGFFEQKKFHGYFGTLNPKENLLLVAD